MAITPHALPSIAAKIAVAPSLRSSSAGPSSVATSIPAACIMARLPRTTLRPSTSPVTPLPAAESKSSTLPSARLRSAAARTTAAANGCSLALFEARGEPQQLIFAEARRRRAQRRLSGLPSVSVPVLSTTSVSIFSNRSSASAFLISTPDCAPRPTPTMIDIGVASPSAQGQAMISTETAATKRIGVARLGTPDRPGDEGCDRNRDHQRHEPAGNLIGKALDRRAAALRLRDHLHDLREHRVAADLVGPHHEAAALVHRPADQLVADGLHDRHRLSGHHRFVDRAAAFDQARRRPEPSRPGAREGDRRPQPLRARHPRPRRPRGCVAQSLARDREARG